MTFDETRRLDAIVQGRMDTLKEHERCTRLGLPIPEWVARSFAQPGWPFSPPTAEHYAEADRDYRANVAVAENARARAAKRGRREGLYDLWLVATIAAAGKPDPAHDEDEMERLMSLGGA